MLHPPSCHPLFVELPQLSLGSHCLKIVVQNSGPNPAEQLGVLEFLIRAPKARLDAYKSLFRVSVDPERASLDDLWRGAVTIEVHGPEGRTVTPMIELCSGSAPTPLARKVMPTMTMPAAASAWKKLFREHCDGDRALDNEFDAAKYCKLQFDAGDLGTTTLLFEHERKPLRWLVQREGHGLQLRLVNEGLDIDAAIVDFYPYEHPDQPTTSSAKAFYNETAISPPSGLFVASCGDTRTGMITPPAPVIKGLAGLGMTPQLAHSPRTVKSVESLIRLCELWSTARIVHHPVSFSFRRRVLLQIELAICDLLYGEAKLLTSIPLSDMPTNDAADAILQKLVGSIPEGAVRAIISKLASELRALPTMSRAEYFARKIFPLIPCATAIPAPDSLNGRPWMAEFALRLASAADSLEPWAADRLSKGLEFLLKHNTIFRAARFIVLAGEVTVGPRPLSAGALHEQWEWA